MSFQSMVVFEEFELSSYMRRTMASAAVNKDKPRFEAFCKQLLELPFEERFPFAFDFFESINGFPEIEAKPMKSSVEALKFKNWGNDAFRRGDSIQALKLYTQSVSVAPVGSPDLAVAFGNRSAVLLKLQRYEGCLVDINRALGENCPEATKTKLLNRKQKCRSIMMKSYDAENDIQKYMKKLSVRNKEGDCPIDEDAMDLDYTGKCPLPKAKLKNKNISNATEKIKIQFNSTFGRHYVAVEDIEVGENIAIEKAYSSVLFKKCQYSHCANCFLRCEALIPCPGCSAVMYCSQLCREEGFNRSHRIECQIFSYSYSLGLPLTSSLKLAIQTLIVVTSHGENLEKLMKDTISKNPMKRAPNPVPEKLSSHDAVHHILSLLNDDRLWAYPHDTSISEAALSLYRVIIIGYILRQTTFFDTTLAKKSQDKDWAEERKYAGLLFLKLMLAIPRYTLGIEELLQKKDVATIFMHSNNFKPVGSGFYLFHSLLNHSCYANIIQSQHKDTMVSYAIQPIKAGQQIFVDYGADFLKLKRYERQDILRRQYQFECRCVACEKDWPLYSEMIDLSSLFCSNIKLSQMQDYVDKTEKFGDNPLRLVEYSTDWFKFFCKYLTIFHNCKKPTQDHFFAFIAFQLLMQSRGNNYVYTRDNVLMSL